MRSLSLTRSAVRCVLLACLAACADRSTAPQSGVACGGADLVRLDPLQSATLDCGNDGTSLTLAAGGASYLVVPQFATGGVEATPVGYTLVADDGAAPAASVVARSETRTGLPGGAARLERADAAPPGAPWPGRMQLAFDMALRSRTQRAMRFGEWTARTSDAGAAAPRLAVQTAASDTVGSVRQFSVIASLDAQSQSFQSVAARLAYVGQNVLVYIDTLAPTNGFTPAQLAAFGNLFDGTLYPLDVDAFGTPSDIDGNGRLVMLLSPVVNAITPRAECATQGFVAGFFFGFDLVSTNSSSNRGEIFYGVVPDSAGTVSCAHTVKDLLRTTPPTFLHELQHLISFSQHVIVHGGQEEEGWLDEGLSRVAEELGSIHYEQRYPAPTGRTNPDQLFPDSAEAYVVGVLTDSYRYLLRTDTVTVTLHSDADGGLAWRGGDWLLLRWLGDQKGTGVYKALEQSTLTGTANIAGAAGESFPSLFGDFSIALWADSVPGISRAAIPPADRFVTRNLRELYQALFNAAGPSTDVPRPFPIELTALSASAPVTATMVPGTMSFYRLDTRTDAQSVQLHFTASGGGALPTNLKPQVSVFRLPDSSP